MAKRKTKAELAADVRALRAEVLRLQRQIGLQSEELDELDRLIRHDIERTPRLYIYRVKRLDGGGRWRWFESNPCSRKEAESEAADLRMTGHAVEVVRARVPEAG